MENVKINTNNNLSWVKLGKFSQLHYLDGRKYNLTKIKNYQYNGPLIIFKYKCN
jgi:hypothetical protein